MLRAASPLRVFFVFCSGILAAVSAPAVRPFRVGWLSAWLGVARFPLAFFSFRWFLWLLWLAFAVRVLCLRRFRRWFRRAFLRLFPPVAAWRSAALRGADRFALSAARGSGAPVSLFSASSFGSGAVLLRGGRRLWFRRSPLPVRVAVWSLLFLRLVRSVCFRRLRLRAAFPVSVRVRGLRSLLRSVSAFRLSFFLALVRAFRLLLLLPSSWSGSWVSAGSGVWSSGFRFVPSSSLLCRFSFLFSYIYICFLLDLFISFLACILYVLHIKYIYQIK